MVDEEVQRSLPGQVTALRAALSGLIAAHEPEPRQTSLYAAHSVATQVLREFDEYVEKAAKGERFADARQTRFC